MTIPAHVTLCVLLVQGLHQREARKPPRNTPTPGAASVRSRDSGCCSNGRGGLGTRPQLLRLIPCSDLSQYQLLANKALAFGRRYLDAIRGLPYPWSPDSITSELLTISYARHSIDDVRLPCFYLLLHVNLPFATPLPALGSPQWHWAIPSAPSSARPAGLARFAAKGVRQSATLRRGRAVEPGANRFSQIAARSWRIVSVRVATMLHVRQIRPRAPARTPSFLGCCCESAADVRQVATALWPLPSLLAEVAKLRQSRLGQLEAALDALHPPIEGLRSLAPP